MKSIIRLHPLLEDAELRAAYLSCEEALNEKTGKFFKPTQQEVIDYCKERNRGVNPVKWFNHYTSNGWKVGKNPMKDWKAAVHTWEETDISLLGSTSKGSNLGGSKLPQDYGKPSPTAVPMPESLKKRLANIGKQ
jgi:hypothetical protein